MRFALVLGLGLLAGCGPTHATQQPERSVPARSTIVPLVDHHQHLVGPMQIEPPPASLPEVTLTPELDRVRQAREQISGTEQPSDVYTDDVLVLDVSEGEDHWVRGREAAQRMASAYRPNTRFVPNAYAVDGALGYIAGVVRNGSSTADGMHFFFGLRRDDAGVWRIAVEYATNKPQPELLEPLTAERLIALLDDAGIERAVVLSTAYWFGSAWRAAPPDEAAKVREANDWTAQEAARYPNRLVAFCGVNPLRDYAIAELRRCAASAQVKGMKLHFGNSDVDLQDGAHVEAVREFVRVANELGMAIVVHLWTTDPSYGVEHTRVFLEQILPAAPDIVVQIAHAGGAGRYVYDDVLALLADARAAGDPRVRNLYVDLATVVDESVSEEMLGKLAGHLRRIGLDRVLYGSDMPTGARLPPVSAWVITRRLLPLSDDELRIIAGNVAPYLSIPPQTASH
jgi:predicted TIM-barrel fold metal-dependent hydrolase